MKRTAAMIWCLVFAATIACAGQGSEAEPSRVNSALKVDQVGYLADAPKIALLASAEPAANFVLRRADSGEEIFRGNVGPPADDPDSGDRVQAADFSSVTKPGKYFLEVPGVGRSWTFAIAPDVFART